MASFKFPLINFVLPEPGQIFVIFVVCSYVKLKMSNNMGLAWSQPSAAVQMASVHSSCSTLHKSPKERRSHCGAWQATFRGMCPCGGDCLIGMSENCSDLPMVTAAAQLYWADSGGGADRKENITSLCACWSVGLWDRELGEAGGTQNVQSAHFTGEGGRGREQETGVACICSTTRQCNRGGHSLNVKHKSVNDFINP